MELLQDLTPLPAIVICLLTIVVAYIFRRIYFRRLRNTSMILKNPTGYKFVGHLLSALVYIVGFGAAVYTIPSLRSLATSMLAGAGILTVVVGFASQDALSNIVGGLFIVIFKPFRVNDRLEIRTNLAGIVEDITLRHTVIRDYQNRRIVIPNSIISDEVIVNADMGESKICRWFEVGISYDSDVDKAKAIIQEEAEKHRLIFDNRSEEEKENGAPVVRVRVVSLGDSSVNLRAWLWAASAGDGFEMFCDLNESVKRRFDSEGIEIPFPHRTLVMKNESPKEIQAE